MTQLLDSLDFAQKELTEHLKNQTLEIALEIEIDSECDCFGLIFRVWFGIKHLGNFFYNPIARQWVAEAFCKSGQHNCISPDEAKDRIVEIWEVAAFFEGVR